MALLLSAGQSNAQTNTLVLARIGGWNTPTFHFLDVVQTRGRLVLPDIGDVDFGKSNYHELFGGGGVVAVAKKQFAWVQECYFVRAVGSAGHGASYLQPWTFFAWSIPRSHFIGESLTFTYLPLNQAGRIQYVVDRAKLERDFRKFKLGVGYAAYQFAQTVWQNKPFLTGTFKAGGLGSMELWVQRVPGNHIQLQLRYAGLFRHGQ